MTLELVCTELRLFNKKSADLYKMLVFLWDPVINRLFLSDGMWECSGCRAAFSDHVSAIVVSALYLGKRADSDVYEGYRSPRASSFYICSAGCPPVWHVQFKIFSEGTRPSSLTDKGKIQCVIFINSFHEFAYDLFIPPWPNRKLESRVLAGNPILLPVGLLLASVDYLQSWPHSLFWPALE